MRTASPSAGLPNAPARAPTSVWNTLAVHGITPRNRINGST
ncbi:hypothetical protein ABIE67_000185 [Streptomyces sp. V4I8]